MRKSRLMLVLLAILLSASILLASCENPPQLSSSTNSSSSLNLTETRTSNTDGTTDRADVLFSDVSEYLIVDWNNYASDEANFNFRYPDDWEDETDPKIPTNSTDEGSLYWGAYIYIPDGDADKDFIYILKSESKTDGLVSFPRQDFVTLSMSRAILSYYLDDGRYSIYLSFTDHPYHGVIIRTSDALFTRYKPVILGILKSIELSDSN